MHTKNINNTYGNLSLVLLVFIMALTACENDGGPAPISFTAKVLSRDETVLTGTTDFKPDYYRTHYTVFSIRSTVPGEYRIGAKLASKPAPTAAELVAATAAITRTLGTTDINIYLPTHIEGTHFNAGETKSFTTAANTMLSANTAYTIYITLADSSGAVKELLDITTDADPANTNNLYGMPSGKYEYTIGDEPLLFEGIVNANVEFQSADNVVTTITTNNFYSPQQVLGYVFFPNTPNYIAERTSPPNRYLPSVSDVTKNIEVGSIFIKP